MNDDTPRRLFGVMVLAVIGGFGMGALATVEILEIMQRWRCAP